MPSQDFDATREPQDLVVVLSLDEGTGYTVQVLGLGSVYLREQVGEPDVTARGHVLQQADSWTITPQGDPIWCWTDDPDGSAMIVTPTG